MGIKNKTAQGDAVVSCEGGGIGPEIGAGPTVDELAEIEGDIGDGSAEKASVGWSLSEVKAGAVPDIPG